MAVAIGGVEQRREEAKEDEGADAFHGMLEREDLVTKASTASTRLEVNGEARHQ
jgi:hypothetical protein